MSKTYFIESGFPPNPNALCDKCLLKIMEVQDGIQFWNGKRNPHNRNICRNCFDVWNKKRIEGAEIWRAKHAALKAEQHNAAEAGK